MDGHQPAPTITSRELRDPKPCPRCYAPMVKDPASPTGWACVKHGAPGGNGKPTPAPPLPAKPQRKPQPVARPVARPKKWTRTRIIARIRELAVDGVAPSFSADRACGAAAAAEFGKWNLAVEAAGFEARPRWGTAAALNGRPPIAPARRAQPQPRKSRAAPDPLAAALSELPLVIQQALFNNALRDVRRLGHELANMLDEANRPEDAERVRTQIRSLA